MKQGRKTKQWNNTRRQLKKEFEQKGITFCEVCGSNFGLSFAHRQKRRFITEDTELKTVALLCIPCHQSIEQLPHSEMFKQITEIIEQR